jgi:glycosyltransferase involved in cell wall biosynthesis
VTAPKHQLRIAHLLGDRQLPKNPDTASVSGVVRVALELARAQVLRGHDVRVVTVAEKPWQCTWQGVTLQTLRASPYQVQWRGRTLELKTALPYSWLTWQHTFDVVHSHLHYYQRFLRGRLRVVHFHTDPLYKGTGASDISLNDASARLILQHSNVQLAVSQFVGRQARSRLGDQANIHVVPNGVDLTHFADRDTGKSWRAQLGLPHNAVVFLFAGALVPEKGVLELAKAFAQLSDTLPQAQLLLAGSKGLWGKDARENDKHMGYEQGVMKTLAEAQQRGQVHYLGAISSADMPQVYAASDVVVVPSVWQEAFGLVALEALAAGKALIASDAGGLCEIARHAQQLLVPPGDVAALESAMRELVTCEGKRQQLSRLALETAPHFSWQKTALELETIYFRHLATRKEKDALHHAST